MNTSSELKLNRKIINIFKYIVFIFAFLVVGAVFNNKPVDAISYSNETMDMGGIYVRFNDDGGIWQVKVKVCKLNDDSSCVEKTLLNKTVVTMNYVDVYLYRSGYSEIGNTSDEVTDYSFPAHVKSVLGNDFGIKSFKLVVTGVADGGFFNAGHGETSTYEIAECAYFNDIAFNYDHGDKASIGKSTHSFSGVSVTLNNGSPYAKVWYALFTIRGTGTYFRLSGSSFDDASVSYKLFANDTSPYTVMTNLSSYDGDRNNLIDGNEHFTVDLSAYNNVETGYVSLAIYVLDYYGESYYDTYIFKYENVDPEISIDTNETFSYKNSNDAKWSNASSVSVSVSDSYGSGDKSFNTGLSSIKYKWGATACLDGTSLIVNGTSYSISVPSNTPKGTNLCIYVTDKAGNSSMTYKFLYIDNVNPSIEIDKPGVFNIWSNNESVEVLVTDSGSGVSDKEYKWESSSNPSAAFTADNVPTSVVEEGDTLYIKAKDVAGNMVTVNKFLKIDKISPRIIVDIDNDQSQKSHSPTVDIIEPHKSSSNTGGFFLWALNADTVAVDSIKAGNAFNPSTYDNKIFEKGELDGFYKLCVYVEDSAGNGDHTCSASMLFDNTKAIIDESIIEGTVVPIITDVNDSSKVHLDGWDTGDAKFFNKDLVATGQVTLFDGDNEEFTLHESYGDNEFKDVVSGSLKLLKKNLIDNGRNDEGVDITDTLFGCKYKISVEKKVLKMSVTGCETSAIIAEKESLWLTVYLMADFYSDIAGNMLDLGADNKFELFTIRLDNNEHEVKVRKYDKLIYKNGVDDKVHLKLYFGYGFVEKFGHYGSQLNAFVEKRANFIVEMKIGDSDIWYPLNYDLSKETLLKVLHEEGFAFFGDLINGSSSGFSEYTEMVYTLDMSSICNGEECESGTPVIRVKYDTSTPGIFVDYAGNEFYQFDGGWLVSEASIPGMYINPDGPVVTNMEFNMYTDENYTNKFDISNDTETLYYSNSLWLEVEVDFTAFINEDYFDFTDDTTLRETLAKYLFDNILIYSSHISANLEGVNKNLAGELYYEIMIGNCLSESSCVVEADEYKKVIVASDYVYDGSWQIEGIINIKFDNDLLVNNEEGTFDIKVEEGFITNLEEGGKSKLYDVPTSLEVDNVIEEGDTIFTKDSYSVLANTDINKAAKLKYNVSDGEKEYSYHMQDGAKIVVSNACNLLSASFVADCKSDVDGEITFGNAGRTLVKTNKEIRNKFGVEYNEETIIIRRITSVSHVVSLSSSSDYNSVKHNVVKSGAKHLYYVEAGTYNPSMILGIKITVNENISENIFPVPINIKYDVFNSSNIYEGSVRVGYDCGGVYVVPFTAYKIDSDDLTLSFDRIVNGCEDYNALYSKVCYLEEMQGDLTLKYVGVTKNETNENVDLANAFYVNGSSFKLEGEAKVPYMEYTYSQREYYNVESRTFKVDFVANVTSITGVKINLSEDTTLRLMNSKAIIKPYGSDDNFLNYYDYTCDYESGVKNCEVTMSGTPDLVKFDVSNFKTGSGKTIEIATNLTGNEKEHVVIIDAGKYDDHAKYVFKFIIVQDKENPELVKVEGPYLGETNYTIATGAQIIPHVIYNKLLAYKITVKDNLQYRLKFDELVTNWFKITGVDNSDELISYKKVVLDTAPTLKSGKYESVITIFFETKDTIEDLVYKHVIINIDTVKASVKDTSNNVSTTTLVDSNLSKFDLVLNTVSIVKYGLSDNSVSGYVNAGTFIPSIEFSREIKAGQALYIKEGDTRVVGCLTVSGVLQTLGINVDGLSEGEHVFRIVGTVEDLYGTTVIVNETLDPLIVDRTVPLIEDINGAGFYNGSGNKILKFKIIETNLGEIEVFKTSIFVDVVKVTDQGLSNVGYCVINSVSVVNNILSITLSSCNSSEPGKMMVTILNLDGEIKDLAGNLYNGKTMFTQIDVVDDSFRVVEYTNTEDFISATVAQNKSRVIEIKLNLDIKGIDSSKISINSDKVSVSMGSVSKVGNVLKVAINAVSGNMDGEVIITLEEGAVTSIYNSTNKTTRIDTNVSVYNGNYKVTLDVEEGSTCSWKEETGLYYCNQGDKITIVGTSNRLLVGVSGSKAELSYKIGNKVLSLESELNDNKFTFVVTIAEGQNGKITILSLDLSAFKDKAINGGVLANSLDLSDYYVDTTKPTFSSRSTVMYGYIGNSYNDVDIIAKYRGNNTDTYVVEGIFDSEDADVANLMLYNGVYYARTGTYTIKVSASDLAGNTNELAITLTVQINGRVRIKLNNKVDVYGAVYEFNDEDVEVLSYPTELENIGIYDTDIKDEIISTSLSASGINSVGSYPINLVCGEDIICDASSKPVKINVNGIEIQLSVTTGIYTVTKYEVTGCTFGIPTKTYDGSAVYDGSMSITCIGSVKVDGSEEFETVSLSYESVHFNSANAGETKYTIYGISLDNANYKYSGNLQVTRNDGMINPLNLDLTDEFIESISKIQDSTSEVIQKQMSYTTSLGDEVVITWKEGKYDSCTYLEGATTCKAVVTLNGVSVNNKNYSINPVISVVGTLVEDNESPKVSYSHSNDETIYSNEKVVISATANDNSITQYNGASNTVPLTYEWRVCSNEVTDGNYSSCELFSSTAIEIDFEIGEVSKTRYVYGWVVDASGNATEVETFEVVLNKEPFIIEDIRLSGKEAGSHLYGLNSEVVLEMKVSHKVEEIDGDSKIILVGNSNKTYTFNVKDIDETGKIMYFSYGVSDADNGSDVLKALNSVVDMKFINIYGTELVTNNIETSFSKFFDEYTITISVESGVLETFKVSVEGENVGTLVEKTQYVNNNVLTSGIVKVELGFNDIVTSAPESVVLVVEGCSTKYITISRDSISEKTVVYSDVLSGVDLSACSGLIKIYQFGGENEASKQVTFETQTPLVLNSSYISTSIYGTMALQNKLQQEVYVDNNTLYVGFTVNDEVVYKLAEIQFTSNKDSDFMLDMLSCANFTIVSGENNVSCDDISMSYDGGILTIEYIAEGINTLTFTSQNIRDYASNEAEAKTFEITFDNRDLEMTSVEIDSDSFTSCVLGEDNVYVCGYDSKLDIKVLFNRALAIVESVLNYSIGETMLTSSGVLVEGYILFEIEFKDSHEGEFKLVDITYDVSDVLGVSKEMINEVVSVSESITIDRTGPQLGEVKVEAIGCNVVDGVSYCNGKNQTVKITLPFDENILKHENFDISTNYNSDVDIIENGKEVVITVVVPNNISLDKFVIKSLTGSFYDLVGNVRRIEISKEIENIKLDVTIDDIKDVKLKLDNDFNKNPTFIEDVLYNDNDSVAKVVKENIVLYRYDVDYGAWFELDSSTELVKDTLIRIKITDQANNVLEIDEKVVVDSVAPKFSYVLKDEISNYVLDLENAYTFNSRLKLTIDNNDTDIENFEILGEGITVEGEEKEWYITINTSGTVEVTISLTDTATNNTSKKINVTYINPRIINNQEGDYHNNYSVTINNLIEGVPYSIKYALFEQNESPYNEAFNKTKDTSENSVIIAGSNVAYNGEYKLVARISAFNKPGYVKELVVDNMLFDTGIEFAKDPTFDSSWTNENIEVTVAIKDDVSGIASMFLLSEMGETIRECDISTMSCEITDNGVYDIKVVDTAGNEALLSDRKEGLKEIKVNNIDRVGYTSTIEANDSSNYKKVQNVTMTFNGEYAPVVSVMYILVDLEDESGNEFVVNEGNFKSIYETHKKGDNFGSQTHANLIRRDFANYTGVFKLHVYVEDAAGNVSVKSSNVIRLDNTAPELNIDESLFVEIFEKYDYSKLLGLFSVEDKNVGIGRTENELIAEIKLIDERDASDVIIVNPALFNNVEKDVVDGKATLLTGIIEGKYKLQITVVDELGNYNSLESSKAVWIDNVGPMIDRVNKGVMNSTPEYSVSAVNSEVNVQSVKYCIKTTKSDLSNCSGTDYVLDIDNIALFPIDVTYDANNPTRYVKIIALDKAGNESVYIEQFSYDTVAPELNINGFGYYSYTSDSILTEGVELALNEAGVYTTDKKINTYFEIKLSVSDAVSTTFETGLCYYVVVANKNITKSMSMNYCDNPPAGEYGDAIIYDTATKLDMFTRNIYKEEYINIFAIDAAGNSASFVIHIDTINKNGVTPIVGYTPEDKYTTEGALTVDFAGKMQNTVNEVNVKKISLDDALGIDDAYELYSNSIAGATTNICSNNDLLNMCSVQDEKINLAVVENGVYVIEVIDAYGNIVRVHKRIINIDTVAPKLNADLKLSGDNAFVVDGGNYVSIKDGMEISGINVLSAQSFIYKGTLNLFVPALALEDSGNASKVTLEICYEGSSCDLIEYNLENQLNTVEDLLKLRDSYTGYITYRLVDKAGNASPSRVLYVENRTSHDIVINTVSILNNGNPVSNDKYYNSITVAFGVNNNLFSELTYYLVPSDGSSTNRLCEVKVSKNYISNEHVVAPCGLMLDGRYTLKYVVKDILGNEEAAFDGGEVNIDTTSPINQNSFAKFRFQKSGSIYKLFAYEINNVEEDSVVNIYDGADNLLCQITNSNKLCDNDIILDGEEGTYNFSTVVVDKAGNISGKVAYEVAYKTGRKFYLDTSYDPKDRVISLEVDIEDASGEIKEIRVFNGNEQIANKSQFVVNENKYTLVISKDTFANLFVNDVIDATFKVVVIDSYENVEKDDEGNDLELGFVHPAISDTISTGRYDISNPEISYDKSGVTITTLYNTVNEFGFTSDKVLEDVKYVFERTSNNTVETIDNVSKFNTLYNGCKYASDCISGNSAVNTNNNYKFNLYGNTKFESGNYRLVVYVRDQEGHEIVNVFDKTIIIDNTNPTITINGNPVMVEEENVFAEAIEVIVGDATSKLKSLKIVNLEPVAKVVDGEFELNGTNYEAIEGEFTIGEVTYTIEGDKVLVVATRNVKDSTSYNFKIGKTNQIRDGKYKILVVDNVGHVSEEFVSVDTGNEGFIYEVSKDYMGTVGEKYSKELLKHLNIVLLENTETMVVSFYASSSIRIRITMERFANTYTLEEYKQGNGLIPILSSNLEFNLNKNSQLSIASLLGSISIDSLASNIDKIRVETTNVSDISYFEEKRLDFINPEIIVADMPKYKGNRIEPSDQYSKCNSYNCYKLDVEVVISNDGELIAQTLMNIASLFINKVDGVSYSTARATDRLYITYADGRSFNTNAEIGRWESYNILDVVGEYILTFTYSDEAGNNAESVVLIINVKDGINPTITTNLESLVNLSINSKEGVIFEDKGIEGKDNYGFIVDGNLSKTTTNYELAYKFNGNVASFDGNGNLIYIDSEGKVVATSYVKKNGNIYTFYKNGEYKFIYSIKDSVGNLVEKMVTIKVTDKNAPEITDTNVDAVVEGTDYYEVNISNNVMCFINDTAGCLKALTAYDYEDGAYTIIDLKNIKYSSNGNSYNNTSDYDIDKDGNELFRIKNIKFNLVGYYKFVLYSKDYNNNSSEITYIVKVVDTEAPKFEVEGEKVETTKAIPMYYDAVFAEDLKKYSGSQESAKIINLLKAWIKANVVVTQNYSKDSNKTYTIAALVEDVEAKLEKYEYGRYKAVLTAEDSSNNTSSIEIIFNIMDMEAPTIGTIEYSYNGKTAIEVASDVLIKENNLYFKLNGGKDITNKIKYEYQVVVNGISGEWKEVEGGVYTLAHMSVVGDELKSIAIMYRTVDRVGNKSESKKGIAFIFDKRAPEILLEDEQGIAIEKGSVYEVEGQIKVIFRDERVMQVKGYKNNEEIYSNDTMGDAYLPVSGFGHYKYVAKDGAGNESVVEFVILDSEKVYSAVDNQGLNDVGNLSEIEMRFDKVILQEISGDGTSLYFENMSEVGDNDKVYFMGVVPNKNGSIFSIMSEGVKGKIFKEHTSSFPINIKTNITNIAEGYTTNDYIINFNGGKYILIGIQKGGFEGDEEVVTPEKPKEETKKEEKETNMTWLLYVLGIGGVLGGGFLIMKLRKRVRAA